MAKKAAKTTKADVILAALASGRFDQFSPVQVQKMFFLLDKKVGKEIGGPHFNFVPYDYGPFDVEVYKEIEKLAANGLIEVSHVGSLRRYSLTEAGHQKGKALLENFSAFVQQFMRDVSNFVCSHSFADLVAAIYKAYPDMKINSVFR